MSPQINKSISQFLSRSRARNDLSNRAEFLQTLAEKRQTMAAAHIVDSGSTTVGAKAQEVVSCARVDAKTIDRAKQIKYDIMKNEDGPLMRTASIKHPPSNLDVTTEKVPESSKTSDENPRKRRRLAGSTTSSSKSKSKATQGEPPVRLPQSIQDDTDGVPSALVPALDERIRNIEEHLSVRYGAIGQTSLSILLLKNLSFFSTIATTDASYAPQIFGRSPHSTRERVPTLGGTAFQATSSRGSFCLFLFTQLNFVFMTSCCDSGLRLRDRRPSSSHPIFGRQAEIGRPTTRKRNLGTKIQHCIKPSWKDWKFNRP